tara:strand:+ start:889 stop:1170 length:282 start_codon:yes stop_codon:yes gene_type:complete
MRLARNDEEKTYFSEEEKKEYIEAVLEHGMTFIKPWFSKFKGKVETTGSIGDIDKKCVVTEKDLVATSLLVDLLIGKMEDLAKEVELLKSKEL